MIAEAPTTTVPTEAAPDEFGFVRYPSRMADWTPALRSRAARAGWRTRRRQATPAAVREARLRHLLAHTDARPLRLYACDLAGAALPRWEARHSGDARLAALLQVSRRYALGLADDRERLAAGHLALALYRADCQREHRDTCHAPACSAIAAVGFSLWKPAGEMLRSVAYWASWAEGTARYGLFDDANTARLLAGLEAYLATSGTREG